MLRLYWAAGLQPKGQRLHWQEKAGPDYSFDEGIMSEVSQPPPRSVLVSSVGGLNILLGLFGLCTGLLCLVDGEEMSAILSSYTLRSFPPPASPAPASPGAPSGPVLLWLVVTIAGIGVTILALVLLAAGLAILRRLPWGRTLALTLALFSGPVVVLGLLNQEFISAYIAAIYNLLVFAVLLNPRCAAEFEPREAAG
jgi:hypothetical protein